MLSRQSLLLNGLLEQSLVIHNRCTADVISHPVHQSPHAIKLNLGWAPCCVIDRHIALTLCPFAVGQTWRRIDLFWRWVDFYWCGQRVSAHWAHNEIIWNYSQWSGSLIVRATLSSATVRHRWEDVPLISWVCVCVITVWPQIVFFSWCVRSQKIWKFVFFNFSPRVSVCRKESRWMGMTSWPPPDWWEIEIDGR